MKIFQGRFQVLTLLLVGALLLLPNLADARREIGAGTFRDLKGPNGDPPDAGPGPVLKSVMLRIPQESEGPGGDVCTIQSNGVCEVDIQSLNLTICDQAVGLFIFGRLQQGLQPFDVTCYTDITIVFEGIFAGRTTLHDTFTVIAGDPRGGHFSGLAVCECTFTRRDGTVLGPGRIDFFRNNGTFDANFSGSGSFRINRAYGAVAGVSGQGVFSGTIGQQGNYTAVIDFPD